MTKRMTDYTKLGVSPLLVLAAQLGFEVRGFECLSNKLRSGGARVDALSITKDGKPVTDLYLGAGMDGFAATWVDSAGEKHSDRYSIQLRDDGVIKATPIAEAPEVTIPTEPAWQ